MTENPSRPRTIESKLKSCDPQIHKYVLKLEANVAHLTAEQSKLDIENSNLHIDKKRLQIRVKTLETELSKYTPPTPNEAKEIKRLAEEALKKIADNSKVRHD